MREPPNYIRIHKPLPAYVLPVMDATIEQLGIAAGDNRWDSGPAESLERRLIDRPSGAHHPAAQASARAGGNQ